MLKPFYDYDPFRKEWVIKKDPISARIRLVWEQAGNEGYKTFNAIVSIRRPIYISMSNMVLFNAPAGLEWDELSYDDLCDMVLGPFKK